MKAHCPVCNRMFRVTNSGMIWPHFDAYDSTLRCDGAGMRPTYLPTQDRPVVRAGVGLGWSY